MVVNPLIGNLYNGHPTIGLITMPFEMETMKVKTLAHVYVYIYMTYISLYLPHIPRHHSHDICSTTWVASFAANVIVCLCKQPLNVHGSCSSIQSKSGLKPPPRNLGLVNTGFSCHGVLPSVLSMGGVCK